MLIKVSFFWSESVDQGQSLQIVWTPFYNKDINFMPTGLKVYIE